MLGTYESVNWAAVVPMANEGPDFEPFVEAVTRVLGELRSGHVYCVLDGASKDNTRELCDQLAARDPRFTVVWAPQNRNLVDAYLNGFRAALRDGRELIIEMDAGLSHDPAAIPMFLRVLHEGNECAFGSRYINGGSMSDSPPKRRFLSKFGTMLARVLLGAKLHDMTSGFQGFHRAILERVVDYPFESTAHFYQTELRHLLRSRRLIEVPIHYRAPSPRVSQNAIRNSLQVLLHYFLLRLQFRSPRL
jgi:dolichol-phosphate mannosyltransferase